MNNQPTVEKLTVSEVLDGRFKGTNGEYYNISKFSAFKDFKVGETYECEVEQYEWEGFLKNRVRRVMPK